MRDHVRSGRRRLIPHSPLERKCRNGSGQDKKNTIIPVVCTLVCPLIYSIFGFFKNFQLHVSDALANNLRSLFFGLTVSLLTALRLYSPWFCTILPIKDVTT